MVVFDTDHLSHLERPENVHGQRIHERLLRLGIGEAAATIISFEEQTRGWLSHLAQARSITEQVQAYDLLKRHLENYRRVNVLAFDMVAAWQFQRLQKLRLRIGTMDLKIAAIVLVHDATLLTRNLQHFRQVPDLKVEDWTV